MSENSSIIGEKLKVEIFGASHAEKIGVKLSGFPKDFEIDFEKISTQMARRAPGNIAYSTARKEPDIPEIISGVETGVTNGDTIEAVIFNTNQHSKDYDALKYTPRPGHADYTAHIKFDGKLDMRGGGKFSARLTAPIVFAGALCRQLLENKGIKIASHVLSIADIFDDRIDYVSPDMDVIDRLKAETFPVISIDAKSKMIDAMSKARKNLDSIGGVVECIVTGLPVGLGDSLFDGIDGTLAKYIFGVPAVKGIEFGIGFDAAKINGSENNDCFCIKDGKVVTETNNSGGVLGGISNGMPLIFKTAFKPTPSIAKPQKTVNLQTMTNEIIEIKGRHDPCVVPRGAPVVEAVTAIALVDVMMNEGLI